MRYKDKRGWLFKVDVEPTDGRSTAITLRKK